MNVSIQLQGWVPQELYIEVYKEKSTQIDERVKRKHWIKGQHYNVPPGSKKRWINLDEVSLWASGKDTKAYLNAS